MYKIAGHTMGTPEYTVLEALQLFRDMGLDGAEIVVQNGYHSGIPENVDEKYLKEIRQRADELGLQIICLTPYYAKFNSLDESVQKTEIEGVCQVIGYGEILGAKYIRIYGGQFAQDETDPTGAKRKALVESMRLLGEKARFAGIHLVIENHFNTMTVSAKDTISIVEEINHPHVGILYDQANLIFTGQEEYTRAIPLQNHKVKYVHVKDLVFTSEDKSFKAGDVSHQKAEERNVATRIVGEGILDWQGILKKMRAYGYTEGWLSLEYERRWHPQDIPDASIGMKKSADNLKRMLREINGD